ncbi:MAG: MFS transporter [Azospirillaceae bacterium]|nr:MFS transporter [Azospirillaceae bacterium]
MKMRALIGWGIGSFTSASLVGAVGLLHLRFMTDSLGIAMGLAGMLVVVSKVYDAAIDPVMGVISSRTHTRFGRYRPFLLAGGLLSALSLVLLFNVPQALHGTGMIVFMGFSLLLFSTAYTMFRIPYLAIGRSITQDFHERSRLMTFSVYGSSLGGLAATSAAPFLLAHIGSNREGHGLVAIILAALIALGGTVSFLLITENEGATAERHSLSFRDAWAAIRANQPFQCLMGFKVTMFAALALHISAIPYYTRHVLKASDVSLGSYFLTQTLAMMASQLIWVRVARRFGRRNGLMAAALMQAAVMACWFLVPVAQPQPWIQIIGALGGISSGGIFLGLYTVLSDTMDHSRRLSGNQGRDGILAGVFVMTEKATAAFGTFVFSAILSIVGFTSAKDAGTDMQPAGVVAGISLALWALPALAAAAACLFLRAYRLASADAPQARGTGSAHVALAPAALPAKKI